MIARCVRLGDRTEDRPFARRRLGLAGSVDNFRRVSLKLTRDYPTGTTAPVTSSGRGPGAPRRPSPGGLADNRFSHTEWSIGSPDEERMP